MLIGAIGGLSKHAESDKQPPCNHDEVCSMCRIYMYIECSIRTYGGHGSYNGKHHCDNYTVNYS